MSEILTYTGIMFDPIEPNVDLINIRDIAHALSLICRANGHFKHFYSVGQHSVNCAIEARARGFSARTQLGCLLHDGSEAYISDVTRPIKALMPEYLVYEERLQTAIFEKYLGTLTQNEKAEISEMDDTLLYHEFLTLTGKKLFDTEPQTAAQHTFDYVEFETFEAEFLRLFEEISKEI